MVPMSEYFLEPVRSRWDTAARQRSYEGSSVSFRGGRLSFKPGHDSPAADGWSLSVGSGPGQVAKIVHVYGLIVEGLKMSDIYLNRYVVLDVDGRVLAAFPPGVEGVFCDMSDPWFPMRNVAHLAKIAGVALEEAQVDSLQELLVRYPGFYDQLEIGTAKRRAYEIPLFCVPYGMFFMVISVWYAVDRRPDVWFWHVLFFSVGAIYICYGIIHYPPIYRRYLQWLKAKHPERFAASRRRY